MARRGRPPKPTELKVFEGNPGKRDLPTNEPLPPSGNLSPPFELGGIGMRVWEKIVATAPPDMLKPYDEFMLWQFCEAWDCFFRAQQIIENEGEIATSEKGGSYQHPAVGMKNKAADRIKQLGGLIGWSPRDRVGIVFDDKNQGPVAQLAALLSKGKIGSA